jgi:hypothetical protein
MVEIVYIIEEENEGVQAVFSSEALAKEYLVAEGWKEEGKGEYSGWWSKTSFFGLTKRTERCWVEKRVVDEEVK